MADNAAVQRAEQAWAEQAARVSNSVGNLHRGGGGGNNGDMEVRIRALEEHVKDTRGTLESIQRQLARLDERMSHMPTTKDIYTIVFSVYGLSFTC